MHHAYLDKVSSHLLLQTFQLSNTLHTSQLWTEWQGDDESRINDLEDAGNETQSEPETGYVVR